MAPPRPVAGWLALHREWAPAAAAAVVAAAAAADGDDDIGTRASTEPVLVAGAEEPAEQPVVVPAPAVHG